MQLNADQNSLLQLILSMSPPQQERYFESLTVTQRETVKQLLEKKCKQVETFDIFDTKASFSEWLQAHFYVPELNGPIWLAPYQIAALNEATKKDKDGLYAYSLIAWMDIKKSIKSCIAGAIALRMAFLNEWGSIKVVANKAEQAASRSYFYITRSLKLNPVTAKMLKDDMIRINNYTINFFFNNTTIKAIPLNPQGEAGGNDDCIIWTEAWASRSKDAQTMFTEMVIPPNKFGRGFKWLESYAGFTNDSPILEPIYQNNVKPEFRIANTDMYKNHRTFVLCNHTPQLPWQTSEYYQQQATELIDSEFRRVHKNEWVSSQNKFLDDLLIDAIIEKLPPLTEKESVIMAADAAVSGDCFAFVGVTKHPTKPGCYAARLCKTWKPPHNGKIIFEYADAKLNASTPDGWITEIAKKYKVIKVVYDPYQLHSLATKHNFGRKSVYWDEFSQGGLRLEADAGLQRAIIDRTLYIDDSLIDLIQHLKNADAETNDDNKIRLVKRNQSLKIDAVVCLSMALNAISRLSI